MLDRIRNKSAYSNGKGRAYAKYWDTQNNKPVKALSNVKGYHEQWKEPSGITNYEIKQMLQSVYH